MEALGALRHRAAEARSTRALGQLLQLLRGDPRPGARALAARIEKRLADERRERRRLAALFALRRRLALQGARIVAGVDEVGMGPLAGPIVAAAVVLPERVALPGLDDSKRVLRADRERLAQEIRAQALAFGVAEVWPDEIARRNVYRAGLEAMRRAVLALGVAPDHVLVDARTIPGIDAPQTPLVGGDGRDGSIAAASIVAKVHRDAIMVRLDDAFPGYGFALHKGYATASHLAALRERGPCLVHRRSFAPVSQPSLL
jgi:ribonuclease HII